MAPCGVRADRYEPEPAPYAPLGDSYGDDLPVPPETALRPGLMSPQIRPNVSIPVDAGALTMTTTNTRRGSLGIPPAARRANGDAMKAQVDDIRR